VLTKIDVDGRWCLRDREMVSSSLTAILLGFRKGEVCGREGSL
jgi:hypothetical protein